MTEAREKERNKRYDAVVKAVRKLARETKQPPTVREIAACLGRSVGPVHKDLKALRERNIVTWEEGKQRTIRLVP